MTQFSSPSESPVRSIGGFKAGLFDIVNEVLRLVSRDRRSHRLKPQTRASFCHIELLGLPMGSLLSTERSRTDDGAPENASPPRVAAPRQQRITALVPGRVERTDARWLRTQRTCKLPIEVLKRIVGWVCGLLTSAKSTPLTENLAGGRPADTLFPNANIGRGSSFIKAGTAVQFASAVVGRLKRWPFGSLEFLSLSANSS
jgi:hypothetical protein